MRLSSGCKSQGPSGSHGSTPHAHAGLTFFCQATRLSGLTYTELVNSLHRLHKAGAPLCGADGVLREGVLTQDQPLLFLLQASSPQVCTAPTLRYLSWPSGRGQNTRRGTGPHTPKSDFPSPTPPATRSSGATSRSAAKVKAREGGGAGHARGGAGE